MTRLASYLSLILHVKIVLFCWIAVTLPGCVRDELVQKTKETMPVDLANSNELVITNSIGLELIQIPAGEFFMGSASTDSGAREDEQPRHRVRISNSFYLGVYEVTQEEFESVMGTNPSYFKNLVDQDCLRFPADCVTWHDAVEFCQRLSGLPAEKQAGRMYRLPTESEWEYACRAGTTTVFHYGDDLSSTQANFNGHYPFGDGQEGPFLNRTTAVGSYAPNAFGLYDMHGNLHEWCADRYQRDYYKDCPAVDPQGPQSGSSPVIRGGDWYSDARDCRSAFRYADAPDGTFYALGFRVVCESILSARVSMDKQQPLPASEGQTGNLKTGSPEGANTKTPLPSNLVVKPLPTSGEDWPRWRGRQGEGTWHGPLLLTSWPEGSLKRVWKQVIGGGYGGVSVVDGRVYVMDRQLVPDEVERVLCFDAVGGDLLWSHSYQVDYSGVAYGNGPRTTPTIVEGRVFTLGAVGHLICFEADSGEVVWSKDLVADFGARVPLWGLSASPLVFENMLIVHAGVEPNGCYLAFDRKSGDLHWQSLSDPTGYATPIIVQAGPDVQLVVWTPVSVRGLDPRTGSLLWTEPFEVTNGTAVATPIFQEGLVVVSSYYDGTKAICLSEQPNEVEVSWHDRRNLRGLMSQPLYRSGYVYLLDKRHGLTCFELASGEKQWDDDNRMTPKGRNPQATMVWLDEEDKVLALNSDGDLILMRLNPEGYTELARSNIIGDTWAHPGYAGNCIYARSDEEIICVVLPVEVE